MARLFALLQQEDKWSEVLTCGQQLLEALDISGSARTQTMRAEILCKVVSKAYEELGQPDKAIQAVEEGLAVHTSSATKSSAAPHASIGSGPATYELQNRGLLSRLYDSTMSSDAIADAVPSRYVASSISNSLRMVDLAEAVHDHQQHAAAATDLAVQYTSVGNLNQASSWFKVSLEACLLAHDTDWSHDMQMHNLPLAIDCLNQQGLYEDAYQYLQQHNVALEATGRSTCTECIICHEAFNTSTAAIVLACGHTFHRCCVNEWFGHLLYTTHSFSPACPLCKRVDPALRPSDPALKALDDIHQYEQGVLHTTRTTAGTGGSSTSSNSSRADDGLLDIDSTADSTPATDTYQH
eukprot:jgi/Chrzof1/2783/Cz11g29080.t1